MLPVSRGSTVKFTMWQFLVKKAGKDQPDQPIPEEEAVHKLIDREIVARN